jgi:hypothetical protein
MVRLSAKVASGRASGVVSMANINGSPGRAAVTRPTSSRRNIASSTRPWLRAA